MKKLMFLVAIFCIISTANSYSQLINFNAYELSYKVKVNGVWNEWSEWEDCNININY